MANDPAARAAKRICQLCGLDYNSPDGVLVLGVINSEFAPILEAGNELAKALRDTGWVIRRADGGKCG